MKLRSLAPLLAVALLAAACAEAPRHHLSTEQKALITITTARSIYKDAVKAVDAASAAHAVSEDKLDKARTVLRVMKPVVVAAGLALENYLTNDETDATEVLALSAQLDALLAQLAEATPWRSKS